MNVKTLTAAVTMALAGCATKAPAPTPAATEDAPDALAPPRAQPTTYGERMVRSLWTQSVSRAMGLEPEELDALDWPCALRWGGERAGDPAPLEVSYDAGVVTRVRASGAFEGGVPSGLYQYTHAQGDTLVEVLFCADGRERCDDGERATTRVVRRGEGELWLRRTRKPERRCKQCGCSRHGGNDGFPRGSKRRSVSTRGLVCCEHRLPRKRLRRSYHADARCLARAPPSLRLGG